MAAMKPRTGDGPLEVEREARGIVVRIPVDGGGRLVLELNDEECVSLKEALASVEKTTTNVPVPTTYPGASQRARPPDTMRPECSECSETGGNYVFRNQRIVCVRKPACSNMPG